MNNRSMALVLGLVSSAATFGAPAKAAPPTAEQCATADETAQTLRGQGELRAARERLRICTQAVCPAAVRDDCTERFKEVEKAMPTIVFVGIDAGGNEIDLSAARVTIDEVPLADRLSSTPLAVDPGRYARELWIGPRRELRKAAYPSA